MAQPERLGAATLARRHEKGRLTKAFSEMVTHVTGGLTATLVVTVQVEVPGGKQATFETFAYSSFGRRIEVFGPVDQEIIIERHFGAVQSAAAEQKASLVERIRERNRPGPPDGLPAEGAEES